MSLVYNTEVLVKRNFFYSHLFCSFVLMREQEARSSHFPSVANVPAAKHSLAGRTLHNPLSMNQTGFLSTYVNPQYLNPQSFSIELLPVVSKY